MSWGSSRSPAWSGLEGPLQGIKSDPFPSLHRWGARGLVKDFPRATQYVGGRLGSPDFHTDTLATLNYCEQSQLGSVLTMTSLPQGMEADVGALGQSHRVTQDWPGSIWGQTVEGVTSCSMQPGTQCLPCPLPPTPVEEARVPRPWLRVFGVP